MSTKSIPQAYNVWSKVSPHPQAPPFTTRKEGLLLNFRAIAPQPLRRKARVTRGPMLPAPWRSNSNSTHQMPLTDDELLASSPDAAGLIAAGVPREEVLQGLRTDSSREEEPVHVVQPIARMPSYMRPRNAKSPAPQRRASSPALQRTGSSSTVPLEGNLGTTVVRVLFQSALATAAATGCCACGHLLAWLRVHVPLTRASITNFDRAGGTRSRRRNRQGDDEARSLRMDVLDLRVFGGGRLCCRSCSHPS